MIPVLLLGGSAKQKSAGFLCDILRTHFSVFLVSSDQFSLPGAGFDFVIAELDQLSTVEASHPIILCKEPFAAAKQIRLPPDAIGLLSSGNLPAAEFLCRCGICAMTFGMSGKDTLTLSSITRDSAVLCLQRAINDLQGNLWDPVEIPLALSGRYTAFQILCAASVLMLSGQADILKQILF